MRTSIIDEEILRNACPPGSRLIMVHGKLQNEHGLIHVIAERVDDYSH